MKVWRAILDAWRRHKAQQVRTIPESYFRGYRRLADTRAQIEELGRECSTCRRAVAFLTWHCDRRDAGCEYQPCYIADQLTRADLNAGKLIGRGWVRLPDPAISKALTPHRGG